MFQKLKSAKKYEDLFVIMNTRNNAVFPKTGAVIAILSLILAILALIPSPVFSGAIIVSLFAVVGASMGALSGWKRLAIVTNYIVVVTFLVSPISSWLENYLDFRFIILFALLIGLLLIIGLIINYQHSKKT